MAPSQSILSCIIYITLTDRPWQHVINLSANDIVLTSSRSLQRYLHARANLNLLWAKHFDEIDARLRETHLDTAFSVCAARQRVVKLPLYRKSTALWFVPLKGQFWMTLSRPFAEFVFGDASLLQRFTRFLGLAHVPDEKLFPSLLLASPFRHTYRQTADRFMHWKPAANHPSTLRYSEHFDKLFAHHDTYFFARKVSWHAGNDTKRLIAKVYARIDETE